MTITDVKSAFLAHIRLHPGCRRRDLPGWGAHRLLSINALYELVDEKKITMTPYRDPANMEYYDKLYIA